MFCVKGRGRGRIPLALGGRRGRKTGIRLPAAVRDNMAYGWVFVLCGCDSRGEMEGSELDDVEAAVVKPSLLPD